MSHISNCWLAWSVLGEADAYFTQETLQVSDFSLNPSRPGTTPQTINQLMGDGLTMTELRQFQGVLNYSGTPLMPLTPSRLMWSLSASSEPFIQASVDTFKGIYGDYVSLMSGVKSSPTPLIPANSPQPH